MEFKCFNCKKDKYFSSLKDAMFHLRSDHKILEKTTKMVCLRNNGCRKKYITYTGLREHVISCNSIIPIEPEVICLYSFLRKLLIDNNFCSNR